MNYDQHQTESGPGPIAAQDWFIDNLKEVMKIVPKDKIICGHRQLWLRLDNNSAAAGKERGRKAPKAGS